jgi:DNA-directed RNA polymerase alpha subunit
MQVKLNQQIALGNGTRPLGFVLGETTDIHQAHLDAMDGKLENFELAEGVKPSEALVALQSYEQVVDFDLDREPRDFSSDPEPPQKREEKKSEEADEPIVIDEAFSNRPIEQTKLSPAVRSTLIKSRIFTLGDLLEFGDKHSGFQKIEGIGEKSETEIKEFLITELSG